MRLKDQIAIVTGGGQGIGQAISVAFAAEGATVIVAARNVAKLEKTVEEIKAKGGRAQAIQTDVSSETQVQRMVSQTLRDHGQIDILINNAGIAGPTVKAIDLKLSDWNEVLAINLTGTMLCAREVLRSMIPRRRGNIINISSELGRAGYPMRSPYCVSKWGIIGLTQVLAVEVGEYNIRVNCISPGAVRGERIENVLKAKATNLGVSYSELNDKLANRYSLRRIAEESEIASAAVFMASAESSAMTGSTLVVNCGQHSIS